MVGMPSRIHGSAKPLGNDAMRLKGNAVDGIIGYFLGVARERPMVEWAHELDRYTDELLVAIERLERENEALRAVAVNADQMLRLFRPADERERRVADELHTALEAALGSTPDVSTEE